ncbi:MAG TPA: acyl-CoA dehydrogenase family protein, partial [Dehalococcoidia bacterium]|nr:acyl-CoA dehydrogenase family protein [Dehalococcoidia bacterium]
MDFRDSPETASFRGKVRRWIDEEISENERVQRGRATDLDWEAIRAVRRKMAGRGWAAPAWPADYGGMGATVRQQAVFNEELAYNRVPGPDFIGINYVGPTLMLYGTEEQKSEHLPAILGGEKAWCQGYSEPSAGSDLASLQTRAIREGDDYVLNGQKIWTSGAHRADWMFLLARTDPDAPKHRGISYFLMDMRSQGIETRPLVNMAGTHEFNEVFFS